MKSWLHSVAVLALLSSNAHALELNPPVNSIITVNSCKYKKTNNTLDLALINRGFFVIRRGEYGSLFYVRQGEFKLNANTELVTAAKDKLMSGANLEQESLSPIKIPTESLRPSPTREIAYGLNLPALSEAGDSHTVHATIYDRLGSAHVIGHRYTKINASVWEISIEIDDQLIKSGQLKFDEYGMVDLSSSINSVSWGEQKINFDFSKVTQYAEHFFISSLHQDGYPMGSLARIEISADGRIYLQYNNGQSTMLNERISVATFDHPELLTPIVDNLYMPNSESGEPVIIPENGNGVFLVGYLEEKFCLPSV